MTNISWAEKRPKFFLLVFSLMAIISFKFYSYLALNLAVVKFLAMMEALALFVYYLISKRGNLYSSDTSYKNIQLIIIAFFISMFMSLVFNDQSLILTYRSSYNYLYICFFFFLLKASPRIDTVEKFIFIFTIIYIVLYLIALSFSPIRIFGLENSKEISDYRGFYRVTIIGSEFLQLSMFIGLNRYVETRKLKWLIMAIAMFCLVFLRQTRFDIVVTLFLALIFLLRKKPSLIICLILTTVSFIIFNPEIIINEDSMIGKMMELTKSQLGNVGSGDSYIRFQEYNYYLQEYPQNIATILFGNGDPHAQSSYGHFFKNLNYSKNFYLSDVGYAYVYIVFGLVGLIFYLKLYWHGFRKLVQSKYKYTNLFMLYILTSNFMLCPFRNPSALLCISLCLYIQLKQNKRTIRSKL